MNNRLLVILAIIGSSFLFSSEKYNRIYLMEFENVNSNFTINNLSKALPDIIIENFEFRGDLTVEYLKSIDPYFPDKKINIDKKNALIINGRFITKDENLDIEIEMYDLSTWDMLQKKSFYCPIDDIACVHDAFLITINKMLEEYITLHEELKARRNIYSNQ